MVDVELVDTCNNYYDADSCTVVLDRKLKQFPEAFEYMKRHELRHHEIYSSSGSRFDIFLWTFWHEFSTDLDYAFSECVEVRQLREYMKDERGVRRPWRRFLVQSLRNFWAVPLYLLSSFWNKK